MRAQLLALAGLLLLAGCDGGQEAAVKPPPVIPDREAVTYFGRMILLDHEGPKAQILLESAAKGVGKPLWFPSVRDAVAFTKLPGESKDIAAIYVTDMAQSDSWAQPNVWIDPADAVFVIESDVRGGMGAPEAVPFSARDAAEDFVRRHGGRIVGWQEIPDEYVLSDAVGTMPVEGMKGGGTSPHDMAYADPLDPTRPGALCTTEGSPPK